MTLKIRGCGNEDSVIVSKLAQDGAAVSRLANAHRNVYPLMRQIDKSVVKSEFDIKLRIALDQFSHQRYQVNAPKRNGRADPQQAERLFTAYGHSGLRGVQLLEYPIDMSDQGQTLVGSGQCASGSIDQPLSGSPLQCHEPLADDSKSHA
jgi:hypothetical protein